MTPTAAHPRYQADWEVAFRSAIQPELRSGMVIIDVGGGRKPAMSRSDLPHSTTYIGLDLSERELLAAPEGSYDRVVVGDVTTYEPTLAGTADLVVSWQVLEHVAPLDKALANVHSYLRPGGVFVAQLSGGWSAFAILNRTVPHQWAKATMARLIGRDPESVFSAPYDRCTYSGLRLCLRGWNEVRILPRYRGAEYFRFLPLLESFYLEYEDLIVRGRHKDLATHYLVVARR